MRQAGGDDALSLPADGLAWCLSISISPPCNRMKMEFTPPVTMLTFFFSAFGDRISRILRRARPRSSISVIGQTGFLQRSHFSPFSPRVDGHCLPLEYFRVLLISRHFRLFSRLPCSEKYFSRRRRRRDFAKDFTSDLNTYCRKFQDAIRPPMKVKRHSRLRQSAPRHAFYMRMPQGLITSSHLPGGRLSW